MLNKIDYSGESIECFKPDQAFLPSYDLAPPPTLYPLAEGGVGEGVGEELNHSTARKPGPLGFVQYSLLQRQLSLIAYLNSACKLLKS